MPERIANQLRLGGLPRINLGLDLAGGSHLLLEADTDDLAKQRLETMEDTIRTEMRRGDPQIEIGDISTSDGQLVLLRARPDASSTPRSRRRARRPQAVGADRPARLGRRGRRFDPDRDDADPGRASTPAIDERDERPRPKSSASASTRSAHASRRSSARARPHPRRRCRACRIRQALKALIGKTAKLEFKLVDMNADPARSPRAARRSGSQVAALSGAGRPAPPLDRGQRRAIMSGDELIDASQAYDAEQPARGQPDQFNARAASSSPA